MLNEFLAQRRIWFQQGGTQPWAAVKDKCYADKPETIDALKDNIREAIVELQLHTIDNVIWKYA